MNPTEEKLPWTDWYIGWRLNPLNPTPEGARTLQEDFYTAGVLGGIGLNHPEHKWSTRFTYPPHWEFVGCRFLAGGCSVGFTCDGQAFKSVILSPQKGILIGEISKAADLSFFSLEHSFRAMGDLLIADLDHCKVIQIKKTIDQHHRFVLVIAEGSQSDLEELARPYLDIRASELWDAEVEKRKGLIKETTNQETCPEMVTFASEGYFGRLRPPTERFKYQWLNTSSSDQPGFDTRYLLPSVEFFGKADPQVALGIFEDIFSFQEDNGGIPAFCVGEGLFKVKAMTWPIIAQSAEAITDLPEANARLKKLLPRIEKYLSWCFSYYLRENKKVPAWNSPQEAFIQDIHEPGQLTPDITVMLLLELEAFSRLAESLGYTPKDLDPKEKTSFLSNLLDGRFWDEKTNSYRAIDQKGERLGFPTISDLLPLAWSGLDDAKREKVLRLMNDPTGFNTHRGTPLWLDETGNPEVAPVSGLHLYYLFYHVEKEGLIEDMAARSKDFFERLQVEFDSQIGLTYDLRYIFHHSLEASQSTSAVCNPGTAAYIFLLARQKKSAPGALEEASAPIAALEEHRKLTTSTLLISFVVMIGIVVGAFILKKTLTISQYEALSGLAIKQYESGRLEQATESYAELVETTEGNIQDLMRIRLASCYLKQEHYQEALNIYDKLYEKDYLTPKMLLNMGLSRYELGDEKGAEAIYQEVIDIYELSNPEFAERAHTAITLIRGEKIKVELR